jgi:hypothetical protein
MQTFKSFAEAFSDNGFDDQPNAARESALWRRLFFACYVNHIVLAVFLEKANELENFRFKGKPK